MKRGCFLGGGLAMGCAAAVGFLIFLPILAAVGLFGVFFGGLGLPVHTKHGLSNGPIATATARPLLWLPYAANGPVPNSVTMALAAAESQGHLLLVRSACPNGTVTTGACAKPPTWRAAGLFQVPVRPPTASTATLTDPSPNVAAANTRLIRLMGKAAHWDGQPLWRSVLQTLATGWGGSGAPARARGPSASLMRTLLTQTYTHPILGAWAVANWNGHAWVDPPHTHRVWVYAVAAAPVGPAWSLVWKRPPPPVCHTVHGTKTVTQKEKARVPVYRTFPIYRMVTVHGHRVRQQVGTKRVQTGWTTHWRIVTKTVSTSHQVCHQPPAPTLTGHVLERPQAMWVTSQGHRYGMRFSLGDPAAVPSAPGAAVWGVQVPLPAGTPMPRITAEWMTPSGVVTATVPLVQLGSTLAPLPYAGTIPTLHLGSLHGIVATWKADVLAAAQRTGVPASWIMAEVITESGGIPWAGHPSGAYGLMQLEPATAQGLPGYTPGARHHPAENILLGAELLAACRQQTGNHQLAIAEYYGGLGTMEQVGYTPGMSWSVAAPLLNVVPAPQAGNIDTMTQYATYQTTLAHAIAPWLRRAGSGGSPSNG